MKTTRSSQPPVRVTGSGVAVGSCNLNDLGLFDCNNLGLDNLFRDLDGRDNFDRLNGAAAGC